MKAKVDKLTGDYMDLHAELNDTKTELDATKKSFVGGLASGVPPTASTTWAPSNNTSFSFDTTMMNRAKESHTKIKVKEETKQDKATT